MIIPVADSFCGVRRNEYALLLCVPPAPERYNQTNEAFSLAAPRVWNPLPYDIRSTAKMGVEWGPGGASVLKCRCILAI